MNDEIALLKTRLMVLATVLIIWFISVLMRLVYLSLIPEVRHLAQDHPVDIQTTLAAGVVIPGVLAFLFKKKDQFLYGVTETAFGVASGFTLVFSAPPNEIHLTQWASLIGCVYIIARGIGNVNEAFGNPNVSYSIHFFNNRIDGIVRPPTVLER